MKVPVLFLMFNRPELAARTFTSIREYQPEVLYLAADGPRAGKEGEKELCECTRNRILEQIDWECKVFTFFRDENAGCGKNNSEAISWMFTREKFGIIIEDDCLPCREFFRYCEELLPLYLNEEKVMQINGFNPASRRKEGNGYTFSRYSQIWGWATWQRVWKKYDFRMEQWPQIRKSGKLKRIFPFPEAGIHEYIWNNFYRELRSGKTPRTWDYQWDLTVFANDGLCVVPEVNLVKNTGIGIEATNCLREDEELSSLAYGQLRFPLHHPPVIALDEKTNAADSARFMKQRWKGAKYKLFRFFNRFNFLHR